jgi:hypothetical protein
MEMESFLVRLKWKMLSQALVFLSYAGIFVIGLLFFDRNIKDFGLVIVNSAIISCLCGVLGICTAFRMNKQLFKLYRFCTIACTVANFGLSLLYLSILIFQIIDGPPFMESLARDSFKEIPYAFKIIYISLYVSISVTLAYYSLKTTKLTFTYTLYISRDYFNC